MLAVELTPCCAPTGPAAPVEQVANLNAESDARRHNILFIVASRTEVGVIEGLMLPSSAAQVARAFGSEDGWQCKPESILNNMGKLMHE